MEEAQKELENSYFTQFFAKEIIENDIWKEQKEESDENVIKIR